MPHVLSGAVTLEQAQMQLQSSPSGLQRSPASEQQLWSYLVQLATALRAVHVAGLAVGGTAALALSKVLLSSRATARVKIGTPLKQMVVEIVLSLLMILCWHKCCWPSCHSGFLLCTLLLDGAQPLMALICKPSSCFAF